MGKSQVMISSLGENDDLTHRNLLGEQARRTRIATQWGNKRDAYASQLNGGWGADLKL